MVAVVVALVTVFCLSFIFKSAEVDPISYCQLNAKDQVARQTTLLLDLTDDLRACARPKVESIAKNIASTLQKYERFSIFVLRTSATDDFNPIFSQCNPGEPTLMDYLSHGRTRTARAVR